MSRFKDLVDASRAANPTASEDIIGKAILQAQAISSLDSSGLLDDAGLQGGSSIAGCYGGIRLSEDLDFVTLETIPPALASAFCDDLVSRAADELGIEVSVKPPKDLDAEVVRWQIRAKTEEGRPDLPLLRVKVEAARIPHYTADVRAFENPALASASLVPPLVTVETPEEIIADKVVSFTMTPSHIRYRDLFDIDFLMHSFAIGIDDVTEMVGKKLADYGFDDVPERLSAVAEKIAGQSLADELESRLDGMLVGPSAEAVASDRRRIRASVSSSIALINRVLASIGISEHSIVDASDPRSPMHANLKEAKEALGSCGSAGKPKKGPSY